MDIWNLEEMPKKEILSDNDKIQEENINKSINKRKIYYCHLIIHILKKMYFLFGISQ